MTQWPSGRHWEAEVAATVELENVMSVIIPRLDARGNSHPYGLGYTASAGSGGDPAAFNIG